VAYKTVTPVTPGTSATVGGDDFNKIGNLLNGQSSDPVTISTNWTYRSTYLKLRNPANTFSYTITAGSITADRILGLPIITGSDTLVSDAAPAALSNKTISGSNNTITNIPRASLPSQTVYNDQNNDLGPFYEDLGQIAAPTNPPAGTRRVFVDSNTGKTSVKTSAGTIISLEEQPITTNFTKGKATFSGNGSATSFAITHGLGSTPTVIQLTPGTSGANIGQKFPNDLEGANWWAVPSTTTITVNYGFAPPSGTNNVIWYWVAYL